MADRDVKRELDALKEELAGLRDQVKRVSKRGRKAADGAGDDARRTATRARERLVEEVEEVLDRLKDASGEVREQGRETVEHWRDKLEEKPVQTAVGALGVGFLLGWLARRKR